MRTRYLTETCCLLNKIILHLQYFILCVFKFKLRKRVYILNKYMELHNWCEEYTTKIHHESESFLHIVTKIIQRDHDSLFGVNGLRLKIKHAKTMSCTENITNAN